MSSEAVKSFVKRISGQIKDFQRDSYVKLKTWSETEETKDYYGIMAPVESYMNLSPGILEPHVWHCFDVGDVVIGRVVSKLERGLNVRLLCFDGGKAQDIESLEIEARCLRSEIPAHNNREDPLSRYSINDLVRGEVSSVHRREQKLTISLRSNPSRDRRLALGITTDENLPVSYKRMCSTNDSYDKLLQLSTGFYNPNVIDFLKDRLVTGRFSSFIKDLKGFFCTPEELAPALRKRQSAKLAKRSVTKGINYYRKGMMIEALQELNHALDVDPTNVDAFVARGALYANKRTFAKAIGDFEKALSLDQQNKNARKYLIEVLIERAKTIEQDIQDLEQIKEAARLYERALVFDPGCSEAKTALGILEKSEKEYSKQHRRSSSTDSASSSDDSNAQTSEKTATIVKVRQLLEHDVGPAKKVKSSSKDFKRHRKRSNSSSSQSSSSSSSSSNSSSSSSSSDSSNSTPKLKKRRTSANHKKYSDSEKSKRKASASSVEGSHRPPKTSTEQRIRSGQEKTLNRQRNHSQSSQYIDSDSRKRKHSFDRSRNRSRDRRANHDSESNSRRNSHSHRSGRSSNDYGRIDERRSSYNSQRSHRLSSSEQPPRRDGASRQDRQRRSSTSNAKATVSKPITKVTKDNFSNILDQISMFEKQKRD